MRKAVESSGRLHRCRDRRAGRAHPATV